MKTRASEQTPSIGYAAFFSDGNPGEAGSSYDMKDSDEKIGDSDRYKYGEKINVCWFTERTQLMTIEQSYMADGSENLLGFTYGNFGLVL